LEIQLAHQFYEHSALVVLTRGIAGLANRHTERWCVEGDMGNERQTPAGDRFNRTTHGFAVADELIQIPCTTWDLGDCPIRDGNAKRRSIHLPEEIANAESDGGRVSSISSAMV
jgi:hypothetical protein